MAARPAEAGCDLPDGAAALSERAVAVLQAAAAAGWSIATAESCTGGLIASLLTDQRGFGRWFDRGFVVYTERAKRDMLGVLEADLAHHGVVSLHVAQALARQAVERSAAGIAVGVTGFAGPAGPDDEAGLVFVAVCDRLGRQYHRECHFGDIGRDATRTRAAGIALELLEAAIGETELRPGAGSSSRSGP